MTSCLQDNDIKMYLTHNNGKCVANNDLLEPLIIKFTNI